MKVKIDTREKFHVITFTEGKIAANMTEEMDSCLLPLLQGQVKNAIINLKDIHTMDIAAAKRLALIQQTFNESQASFVVCCVPSHIAENVNLSAILKTINITPTESEASDIVMMEEIEREIG